jgi:hypothetical protein
VSDENVEIVRMGLQAFARRDIKAMDAFMREYAALHPEFESVMTVKSRAEASKPPGCGSRRCRRRTSRSYGVLSNTGSWTRRSSRCAGGCSAHPLVLDAALGYYREVSFEGLSKLSQPALVVGGTTDIWDPELFNRSPEASTAPAKC